ncbi:Lysophospholipase L1 [Cohaesibacter sp. ES.047]|uniref:GDSL-type esterase/lipase family protein n=1 Tax=Cohaesibacter sp. ES.047 TaxID=1798205 RepID=UPI000BB67B6F|nr:GDSL-type esterase/lipase family protein [Cohaesibacter sp. ES.047]SNY93232.1 Lysophospholipase L1 [Cohaesibacter sp. ES.047]
MSQTQMKQWVTADGQQMPHQPAPTPQETGPSHQATMRQATANHASHAQGANPGMPQSGQPRGRVHQHPAAANPANVAQPIPLFPNQNAPHHQPGMPQPARIRQVQRNLPTAHQLQRTQAQRRHRDERGLTAALLVALGFLGILVILSFVGLFLLQSDNMMNQINPSDSSIEGMEIGPDVSGFSRQQATLQSSAQTIARLEQRNRNMQLQIAMLQQEKADMTRALGELKSLYSRVRIDSSWALTKEDLARARTASSAAPPHARMLYADFPMLAETQTFKAVALSDLNNDVDSELSFKGDYNRVETAGLATTNTPEATTQKIRDPLALMKADTGAEAAPQEDASKSKMVLAALPTIKTIPESAPETPIADPVETGARLLKLPLSKPEELIALQKAREVKLASIAPTTGFEADPEPVQPRAPVSGRAASFLSKMAALRAGNSDRPIRILHIGDSHIASDSLTRGIRKRLQKIYGDAGRGAVIPAKAYKWAHADGLSLTASRGWSSANSLKVKSGPYGLSGVRVATSSRGAKMTLTSKTGAFDWAEVTLYVGPNQGSATIATEAGSKRVSANAAKAGSKTVRITGRSKTLTVTHAGGGKTTVLNWASGKDNPGIQYVNFGISGATVDVTDRWSDKLIANDIKRINPDLIVYGYGTNEGYNDNLNMNRYTKTATSLLDKMRAAAPNAALMFVGPSDGARRRSGGPSCGGGWYTPKKLGTVRDTLKTLAKRYDALYWDWSSAMGGRCGVTKWSTSNPRLAAKDRVHLTPRGYDRSAGAFVDYLEQQVKNSLKIASN